MKKLLFFLGILAVLISACQPAKYVVTNINPSGVFGDQCIIGVKPVNFKAKLSKTKDALVGCDDYRVNDTIVFDKEHFANLSILSPLFFRE